MSKYNPFAFLTVAVMMLLLIPDLVMDGMFMDGMIYSTVAKNFANGLGTFWDLHLSQYLHNHFREQPPLTFWITALFFKIFGNSLYTERIYSFLCAVIAVFLIRSIWKLCTDDGRKKLWWFPVLIWICIPICFWTYRNNMEENTMSIFILSGVWFYLKCLLKEKQCYLNMILGSTMIFLAIMSKGIQAAFPIVIPLVYALAFKPENKKKYLFFFLINGAVITLFILLLYLYQPSHDYFTGYFKSRLVRTFSGADAPTTTQRYFLLYRLFSELMVPAAFILFVFIFSRKLNPDTDTRCVNLLKLFFLTGLTGALPLMVTLEQRSFYLAPTLPFFTIGLSLAISHRLKGLFNQEFIDRSRKAVSAITVLLFTLIIFLTINNIGKIRRHKEMLPDIHTTGKLLPAGTELMVSNDQTSNWSLYLYFQRYYNIKVDCSVPADPQKKYYLKSKGDTAFKAEEFKAVNVRMTEYQLYERK
jgi:4-amino-4-deoxy-L-arabinose transferase-like glycosyltransferase